MVSVAVTMHTGVLLDTTYTDRQRPVKQRDISQRDRESSYGFKCLIIVIHNGNSYWSSSRVWICCRLTQWNGEHLHSFGAYYRYDTVQLKEGIFEASHESHRSKMKWGDTIFLRTYIQGRFKIRTKMEVPINLKLFCVQVHWSLKRKLFGEHRLFLLECA